MQIYTEVESIYYTFETTGGFSSLAEMFSSGSFMYTMLYVAMIYFFCYFWTAITFNPKEMSENLQNSGTFIPGYRPGKRTTDYLEKVMVRITYVGAGFLALVAILPEFLISGFKVAPIPVIGPGLDMFLSENGLGWITEGLNIRFYFGGTSLLIIVGVAMDTVSQVEAHHFRQAESQAVDHPQQGHVDHAIAHGQLG